MNKSKIADIVLYGSALCIILWAFFKSIGIINSPVWVEMLPYIFVGTALLGIAQKLNIHD
jgi:hypothetical protein